MTQQTLFDVVGDTYAYKLTPTPPPAPPPKGVSKSQMALAPRSPSARVKHNLKVIRLLIQLETEDRAPTARERGTLERWAGWGAVPQVFDESEPRYERQREQLKGLLGQERYAAARRSTLNGHYTHPLLAKAMWVLAQQLSFPGANVLEPGCGSGVFIQGAPEGAKVVGVELDPSTAAVARALHPAASILTDSFADVKLDDGTFDLVIGNVPFGDFVLYDPRHNKGRHSIHNHFLVKSLALLRAGGLLVAITSRFTLDARGSDPRSEMAQMADLIGAVRLPSGAHRLAAGTDVITDVLVLRRRATDTAAGGASWVETVDTVIDGEQLPVNCYFVEHPEHVAGTLAVQSAAYGVDLDVVGDRSPQALYDAITALADGREPPSSAAPDARAAARTSENDSEPDAPEPVVVDVCEQWDGHILALADGGFAEVIDGSPQPLAVPKSAAREMRQLLALRDQAGGLLAEEAAHTADPGHLEDARARLRESYAHYRRLFGAINRYKTHPTGRTDPETGEPVIRRSYPRTVRLLLGDPLGPLVLSLEIFDAETQTAQLADILRRRVVRERPVVCSVTTPEDALAVCYDRLGRVDLDTIARLLGLTAREARDALAELVYEEPDSRELVAAAEYLSGNVAIKLARAREAAATDSRFTVNVQALEAVLPLPLGAEEVDAKLGAVWISASVHQQFLSELLEDPNAIVEYAGGNVWGVQARSYGTLARSEWGTRRMSAPEIATALLQQKAIVVKDKVPGEDRYVLNPDETAAAQEKATAMQQRFGEWVWEDPERASALLAEYNTRFNALVSRDYSVLGQALSLPGLAESFIPSTHQRAGVARILSEPAVGLFHEVGAGKTATMVIAAHELRRLGLVSKPVVVVPNHMLEQFAREWLQLYPQARVLAASTEDLAKEHRRRFIARAAANDWDGIIMTRSAFERLGVSPEAQTDYLHRELNAVRGQLEEQRNRGARLTVKTLERMVARAEGALRRRLDSIVDIGLTFEDTGVDYVFADEAHSYKNLATISNIPGAAIAGSKRASDLHMKVDLLRRTRGQRVATFATATPIANSITEAHVMCRHLRPDLLEAAGVEHFDAWAATFGETVTQMEMAVTAGGTYRLKARFARFCNVPELLRIWHTAADVKTAADLNLPAPPIKPRPDGERLPEPVVIPAPPETTAYLQELAERAEKIKKGGVNPHEDNMLLISTHGRKAALDMRLVGAGVPAKGVCKLEVVAENIARIYAITRNLAYRIPATEVYHPTLGALQIVFCDLSTPSRDRWNAYDELRGLLVARGVPREKVRFVHEADSATEKARLFEACRCGQVAVLIGSTEKMGVGVNIQTRAIALHHVDCAWRPADIQQREGRILRQGNQNSAVQIYRYVVEGSFDAYNWQTVERKARFIGQLMRGRLDIRSIEDIGDNTLSYGEIKALAAGDPLILEQAQLSADVTRLLRLQRAYRNNQAALKMNASGLTETLARYERDLAAIESSIERHIDTRGEKFSMTIDGNRCTKRGEAADALLDLIDSLPRERDARKVARLGGLDLAVLVRDGGRHLGMEVLVGFEGLPAPRAHGTLIVVRREPMTLIRQLEARLNGLDTLRAKTVAAQASAQAERKRAQDAIGTPFKHADALQQARDKLEAIEAELAEKAHEQELGGSRKSTEAHEIDDDAEPDEYPLAA